MKSLAWAVLLAVAVAAVATAAYLLVPARAPRSGTSSEGDSIAHLPQPAQGSTSGGQAEPAERDSLTRLLSSQVEAWNRGDLDGFMAGYYQSPDLSFFSGGKVTRGWQPTLDRYRTRYQGEGREMGKLTFSQVDMEFLGVDSAVVRGRWQLVMSKETVGGLFTLLLRKLPEGWRIVHDHTSG